MCHQVVKHCTICGRITPGNLTRCSMQACRLELIKILNNSKEEAGNVIYISCRRRNASPGETPLVPRIAAAKVDDCPIGFLLKDVEPCSAHKLHPPSFSAMEPLNGLSPEILHSLQHDTIEPWFCITLANFLRDTMMHKFPIAASTEQLDDLVQGLKPLIFQLVREEMDYSLRSMMQQLTHNIVSKIIHRMIQLNGPLHALGIEVHGTPPDPVTYNPPAAMTALATTLGPWRLHDITVLVMQQFDELRDPIFFPTSSPSPPPPEMLDVYLSDTNQIGFTVLWEHLAPMLGTLYHRIVKRLLERIRLGRIEPDMVESQIDLSVFEAR
ncbi:hypothetical protein BDZ91DRAFT_838155 [Kalaharituber pfeilii]|nr:hypothetical protein BDZ91DRAFT_838155 [Kalaharituber pfeilii]